MDIDETTRDRPEYGQLKALYGQLSLSGNTKRSFGASFRVFALRQSGDVWIDAHIGHLKLTMTLQVVAMVLTLLGVLLMVTNALGHPSDSSIGDLRLVAVFVVAAVLGIWSLIRAKKGAQAFTEDKRP